MHKQGSARGESSASGHHRPSLRAHEPCAFDFPAKRAAPPATCSILLSPVCTGCGFIAVASSLLLLGARHSHNAPKPAQMPQPAQQSLGQLGCTTITSARIMCASSHAHSAQRIPVRHSQLSCCHIARARQPRTPDSPGTMILQRGAGGVGARRCARSPVTGQGEGEGYGAYSRVWSCMHTTAWLSRYTAHSSAATPTATHLWSCPAQQ